MGPNVLNTEVMELKINRVVRQGAKPLSPSPHL